VLSIPAVDKAIMEGKTRVIEYRLVLGRNQKWRPQFVPKMKKRTALFAKLREVFRQHVSQPVGEVAR
jgi:hypothetical protein